MDLKTIIARNKFVEIYSWTIPSKEIVQNLAKFIGDDIALEIGAGTGLWAHLLQHERVNIIPTDFIPSKNSFTNIAKIDAILAVNKFVNFANVLILIWPPLQSSMAYDALRLFKGKKVIYIGEGFYGCTADNNFHYLLDKEWTIVKKLHNPTWPEINDFVSLCTRK
jgi:hypothetical protein